MSKLKNEVLDQSRPPFERLKRVMEILRAENGCAWDRKQSHISLIPYLIEETHELAEAIQGADDKEICEELGDVLCQIVFHGQIARERDAFSTDDAVEGIINKLVRRHPHIFDEVEKLSASEVRDQWETIKVESGEKKSVLAGLPKSMPALLMAFRIGEKAGGVGFDWKKSSDVLDKIKEETQEVEEAIIKGDKEMIADEIGDLLFATASLARKYEIDPEQTLKVALEKFRSRFSLLEENVKDSGRKFSEYSLEELEEIWQRVK